MEEPGVDSHDYSLLQLWCLMKLQGENHFPWHREGYRKCMLRALNSALKAQEATRAIGSCLWSPHVYHIMFPPECAHTHLHSQNNNKDFLNNFGSGSCRGKGAVNQNRAKCSFLGNHKWRQNSIVLSVIERRGINKDGIRLQDLGWIIFICWNHFMSLKTIIHPHV